MAEYLTNTTDLTKVASAIREKGGTSDSLVYPDGFVTAIQAIQTGTERQIIVTVTSGATVTATKGSLSVSGTSINGSCILPVSFRLRSTGKHPIQKRSPLWIAMLLH